MVTFHPKLIMAAVLVLILSITSLSIQPQQAKALKYRFLIPEGYVGWIRVDFDVTGAPPLPEASTCSMSGEACTMDTDCCSGAGNCIRGVCSTMVN